ncbi:MAG: flagellar hook-associated protein FlgK [Lachnospiraceae bacterium]|jgi:flagellar hook-associated protein 1 FlgK|nr:flagellar hook-associated protein FlgK [Lachnospiraceae bacterium]
MANSFFGLHIGTSGLYAANTWLNITANNISNEQTEGYSRQTATQQASRPLRVYQRYGQLGSGVEVNNITRIRDEYYDVKYWLNQCKQGDSSTRSYYLTQIEDYFADDGTSGFTTEFGGFYNSLEELSKTPADLSARSSMLNYAQNFLEYMTTIRTNLQNTQADINAEISSNVDQINALAKEIAIINKQINVIELQGANANTLRDKRALLLDELSSIVEIDTNEISYANGKSEFYVTICGKSLVNNYDCFSLEVVAREDKADSDDLVGLYDIKWSYGEDFNPATSGTIGTLAALIKLRDGNNYIPEPNNPNSVPIEFKGIPYYINEVEKFLEQLTTTLNDIHKDGVNLYDEKVEDIPLFIHREEDDRYIVNPDILNDPAKMATSTVGTNSISATDIIDKLVESKEYRNFDGGTSKEALNTIITELSIDSKKAQDNERNYTNFRNLIQNQRLSIMGVDKDEEAMNLVKYQEAYDLSAKVIQIMSEVYDKLINETGI